MVLFVMSRTPPRQVDGSADRSDIAAGRSRRLGFGRAARHGIES
ncbi:MAG: hypothetical protein OJF51_003032 [Nitrospira sp.]|nr:MAG: hypothetical protein OJF51_003032 [Nitrospira sp.]